MALHQKYIWLKKTSQPIDVRRDGWLLVELKKNYQKTPTQTNLAGDIWVAKQAFLPPKR